jgi:rhodanese-related sulfurtransferase
MGRAVHSGNGIIECDCEIGVADNLRQMGYTQAISLDGGWRALKDSGLKLEK